MACGCRCCSCRPRCCCSSRCSGSCCGAWPRRPPRPRRRRRTRRPFLHTDSPENRMLAMEWLGNARAVMDEIEKTQTENIKAAAAIMADTIQAERWVHTFGCGHATLPVEEMYPRIGGFVGFHPMIELPLTYFTHITGEMGIHQFLFLERAEGYGRETMKSYRFDPRDTMWIFSHSGINVVNIDVALRAKELGMKVIVAGSEQGFEEKASRHPSGKKVF